MVVQLGPSSVTMRARIPRLLTSIGTLAAIGIAVHTAINLGYLRRPTNQRPPRDESVSVLIPARNEAAHILTTIRSVLAQNGIEHLEIIVLDDGSTDRTAELVRQMRDPRLTLIAGSNGPLPQGWLGKPWACARLGDVATGDILIFVDADVYLEPDALLGSIALLRTHGFSLISPYPRQLAITWAERLVQPLLSWSWMALMPLRWGEHSHRPSLSSANGQFMVFDARAYRAIGGHGAVRGEVIEDIELMRAMKVSGRTATVVDGSSIASCRMYSSASGVIDGYTKSLWTAFNGPLGSAAVNTLLLTAFVAPPISLLLARGRTRSIGALGYLAGVTSRVLVARSTGERVWPDAVAHPASVAAFSMLNALSWLRHLRGQNYWKGRPLP